MCVAVAVAMGCGPTSGDDGNGGSGSGSNGPVPPDSKGLRDLTNDEARALCLEFATDYPEKTVSCPGESPFNVGYTTGECQSEGPAPYACTANVGQLRDCVDDYYNTPNATLCADSGYLPASCMLLDQMFCPY